jgi:hypothetical protein
VDERGAQVSQCRRRRVAERRGCVVRGGQDPVADPVEVVEQSGDVGGTHGPRLNDEPPFDREEMLTTWARVGSEVDGELQLVADRDAVGGDLADGRLELCPGLVDGAGTERD